MRDSTQGEVPTRFHYEENIISNPLTHFGTWTPEGWRVHKIRRGETALERKLFSGDRETKEFSGLPVDFVEDVHDAKDGSSDGGIYPAVPRVEYPVGHPRWAVSHTFLAYPVADQTLYDQEYTWDRAAGRVQTHCRRHVVLEEATTDADCGLTLTVNNPKISTVIAGNKSYPLCNSAVRGVWDNPEKLGWNYYSRRIVRRCLTHNGIYVLIDQSPVIQCHGIWKWEAGDEEAFDQNGEAVNAGRLVQSGIPFDCPKLGTTGYVMKREPSSFYGVSVEVIDGTRVRVGDDMLTALRACQDVPFRPHRVGFAGWGHWDHAAHIGGVQGHYGVGWDLNDNGIVDAADEETLRANLGREVRVNYYSAGYFGNDWLSAGVLLNSEMQSEPVICAWSQGAGYDSERGTVRLFETPGPGRKVYVEYHYDEPAMSERDNIVVAIRRSAPSIL